MLTAVGAAYAADLFIGLRPEPSAVSSAVMAEARAQIERRSEPGDVVVHSPLFSVRELAPLGDLRASPALPGPEIRASRRVLVLDTEPRMHGFGTPDEEEILSSSGRSVFLSIHLPQSTGPVALFDMLSDLARVVMTVERPVGQVKSTCTAPRSEGGRLCPGEPEWLYLAPRELAIAGETRSCIWAHPTTDGAIVFEIPPVPAPPAAKRLELLVEGGLADDAVRNTPDGAEVETAIVQRGQTLGVLTVPNRVGWYDKRVEVSGGEAIQLRVTSARDGRRHHCLRARIEEVAP